MPRLYFVECLETGFIKIGLTYQPIARRMAQIAGLRQGEPMSLRLLALMAEDEFGELGLHRRFRRERVRRNNPHLTTFGHECFRPSPRLLAFIAQLPRHADVGLTLRMGARNRCKPVWEAA